MRVSCGVEMRLKVSGVSGTWQVTEVGGAEEGGEVGDLPGGAEGHYGVDGVVVDY